VASRSSPADPAGTSPAGTSPTSTELIEALQLALGRVHAHFAEVTARAGLTPAQAKAMRYLDEPITLSDLAARLDAHVANVSAMADRLEARGLLRRQVHDTDRRSRVLTLTDEGMRVREILQEAAFDNAAPFDPLTGQQRRDLLALLRTIGQPESPGARTPFE
jgi:DNA-binding MarR family transcriptional regulator